MKVIKYDWESNYLNRSVSRLLLSYDSVFLTKGFEYISIKNNSSIIKSIDQAKLLSLSFVFSNNNKNYLNVSTNKDKNPLKKATSKPINTKSLLKSEPHLGHASYIVLIYLYNYFISRGILFGQKIGKHVFNMKIKEVNSILKVGYAYNVLDLDPPVQFNFVNKDSTKQTISYYLG